MKLVVGASFSEVRNRAIDSGLSLSRPLRHRDAAIGLVLPEYVAEQFRTDPDLSCWQWHIPDKAYEKDRDGARYCTAEFTFLIMAHLLSVEELALFGLELCGFYCIDKRDPKGFVSGVKPQMTVESLTAFLEGCAGARGIKNARRAVRWIANRSASPMESILTLLLCLPRHLGGFGLPMPKLNVSVNELHRANRPERDPNDTRFVVDKGPFVDLYWDGITLESDSYLEHTGRERIARDSLRRILLEELRVRSFSVTTEQVNHSSQLMRVARIVSKYLGRKFHAVDRELLRRNAALRAKLYEFTRYKPQKESSAGDELPGESR